MEEDVKIYLFSFPPTGWKVSEAELYYHAFILHFYTERYTAIWQALKRLQ